MAKKEPSWWRLRQIRHRDAVILAILSASCLLGGQITDNATRLSALQHLGDLRGLRRALPQQPAGPRRPHLARLAGLHDVLRRHLRPPRRTPLLLGPSRTGSVPPGTWAGRELARPRRSPRADDPHDRKAIRRSADRPPRRRRRSLGPRHPPGDRQPHPHGQVRADAQETRQAGPASLAQVPTTRGPVVEASGHMSTNCACGTPSIHRMPPSETNPARIAASTVSRPTKLPIVASLRFEMNPSSETTSPS